MCIIQSYSNAKCLLVYISYVIEIILSPQSLKIIISRILDKNHYMSYDKFYLIVIYNLSNPIFREYKPKRDEHHSTYNSGYCEISSVLTDETRR